MSIRISSKEQEELVVKNLGLVHYHVNKFRVTPSDYDDFVSVGTIGIIKAAVTYDKSKSIKFSTYASKCINNEILMHIRSIKKYVSEVSLDDPINEDSEGKEMTLGEILPSSTSYFVEELVERDTFEKLISIILNLLTPKKRLVMLYTIGGESQLDIGEKLNISQSYVSRLIVKLEKEIKEYYTTIQEYKEVFKMAVVGDSYKISFFSKDVKNFNVIFATFLQNLTSGASLPDFRVVCNNERIVIQVPAHPESFSFVAQIIQEIDDYTLSFVNTLPASTDDLQEVNANEGENTIEKSEVCVNAEENEEMQEMEVKNDVSQVEVAEKTDVEEENEVSGSKVTEEQIISDTLSSSIEEDKDPLLEKKSTERKGSKVKKIRDYMLTLDTFTAKQLKQQFPEETATTIGNALFLAKSKGLIISVGKGQYATKKV